MLRHRLRAGVAILTPCMAFACASTPRSEPLDPMALPSAYETVAREDFPEVVEEVARAARHQSDDMEAASSHRLVALLHLHPQNPEPDLRAALDHLELSASLDPKRGSCAEVQTWIAVLRSVVGALEERQELQQKLSALEKQLTKAQTRASVTRASGDKMRRESETLASDLEKARAEIVELRATIDKLQRLDLRMERRRQRVRTTTTTATPASSGVATKHSVPVASPATSDDPDRKGD